jgi:tetratricopeptide (TPR) repeat protein
MTSPNRTSGQNGPERGQSGEEGSVGTRNREQESAHRGRIPESFLAQLKEDVGWRRIDSGLQRLEAHRALIESCDANQKGAGVLLGYLAQWVDIGFARLGVIQKLLERFSAADRETLTLREYVHSKMAEGLVAMSEEEFAEATHHFEVVLALEEEIRDKQVISIANYWVGRCLRRQGRYNDALGYVAKARELALRMNYPKMAAVMRVLEAWIAFQEGEPEDAAKILREAEEVLADTDDYVTRGNISSAYGRIARRLGDYDQALARFAQALEEYGKRDPHSRNLARSFVNIAFVKRLVGLQLRDKIDAEAARYRKKQAQKAPAGSFAKTRGREELRRLREEAFEHLAKAREIYDRYDDHRGKGNVYITYGYLYLDNGELDRASSVGATAFSLAEEKNDNVLKARARILQCAVEGAKFEEQIEEGPNRRSSQTAVEFAREALECAKRTQNRRLIAKAHIALGLALCLDFSDDTEAARECADEATALLLSANHDYVWKELQELKRRLRGAGNINPTLREWSQGIVGPKSFQQVSEEFAAIVIPKVWRREGCKVARVAARLAISPKKVRRILRNQGLLTGSAKG